MPTDPTRTLSLRRRYEGDIFRRFRALKGLIRESLVKNDALALTVNRAAPVNAFDFPTSDAKVMAFMDWLREQEAEGIISVQTAPGRRLSSVRGAWQNVYIESAYQQGIHRARTEIAKAGGPRLQTDRGSLQMAFNQPTHADRVGLIFTRAYDELEGITQAMNQQISRELAQGLIDGDNPLDIARRLNNRVDKIGITRSRMLARTEVIRAHHSATMQEYREAGAMGINIQAEWRTAQDDRVCNECESAAAGGPYTLAEVESAIPLHPNAVFEGSTFIPYGECEEIVRARYSGPAIVLSVGGGKYRTTIGPNHPMLTARGFVKAAQLTKGDKVLYDFRHDEAGAFADVDNNQIPLCEDSFEAAVAVSSDASVTTSGSDLHGDRVFCQGEVEAIRPTWGLLPKFEVGALKQISESLLMGADAYSPLVSGLASSLFSGKAVHASAPCSVCGSDSGVFANDGFGWLAVDHVEVSHFDGWAFDYTTASSLYCNNGFVVKNCRCVALPLFDGDQGPQIDRVGG